MAARLMAPDGIAAIPITALDPHLVRLLLRSRRFWIPVSYIGAQGMMTEQPASELLPFTLLLWR